MNNGRQQTITGGLVVSYSPVMAETILTPADALKNGIINGKYRVQLRQEITKLYPAARGNALFATEELTGGRTGQSFGEKRVAWLAVPGPGAEITGMPEETPGQRNAKSSALEAWKKTMLALITQRLSEMEGPTLVKTLDLRPILSEEQHRTITSGVNPKSYSDYEQDFIVDGNDHAVKFRGEFQYRKITFSKSPTADVDNRLATLSQKSTPMQIAQGVAAETAKVL